MMCMRTLKLGIVVAVVAHAPRGGVEVGHDGDAVVRAHHGRDAAVAHRGLERRQEELAERALVDDGGDAAPVGLLVV